MKAPPKYPLLLERAAADAFAHSGANHFAPRRKFLQTTGGLFVAISCPITLSGCDPQGAETVAALAVALFKVGLEAYRLSQDIGGDVVFKNNGSTSIALESIFSLVENFVSGDTVDDTVSLFDVDPGENPFSFYGLRAARAGAHLIEMLLAGTDYQTDIFDVTP